MDPECLCDRGERERRIAVLLLHQLFRGQNVLILRLQIAAAAQLDDLPQQLPAVRVRDRLRRAQALRQLDPGRFRL